MKTTLNSISIASRFHGCKSMHNYPALHYYQCHAVQNANSEITFWLLMTASHASEAQYIFMGHFAMSLSQPAFYNVVDRRNTSE
jgi:hypothetical protein